MKRLQIRVPVPQQEKGGDEILKQEMGFNYFGVEFVSEGGMEQEIVNRISATSASKNIDYTLSLGDYPCDLAG